MKVSVFTPSHAPTYLDECWRSLRAQTYDDWEWIVLLNGDATWAPAEADPRIRVVRGTTTGRVGAAKREACALATGDILLELDHDDVLASDCLEAVTTAFAEHPEVVLVYSDFAQIDQDGSANHETFNLAMGWEYAPANVDGLLVNRCRALEPSPHNVAYIWYAPNHVRAFRRTAYERAGGYDAALEVLDDQDLMMRLFVEGPFLRIPRCLYLQRVHAANTQKDGRINREIQADTVAQYWAGIDRLAVAWAQREGLEVVDLQVPAWAGPGDEVIDPVEPVLAHEDSSVGVLRAVDVLQRIPDRGRFFAECFRVLAPGGLLMTATPSTDGRGAFQDPTHVAYWNANSFWYLTQAVLRERTFPSYPGMRFQVSGLRTWFPTEFDRTNDIPYVAANLIAVKDDVRHGGPLLI